MGKELFAEAEKITFWTLARVPFGARLSVVKQPTRVAGRWVAAATTGREAFRVEFEEGDLPGTSFIVVRSSTEDGEHYKCVAVLPEEIDRECDRIEGQLLGNLTAKAG